jgi:hypothetical protein
VKTHYGDPCIHCGIPHDDVPVGACEGDSRKSIPIACRFLGMQWDGACRFYVRFSDGRVEEVWQSLVGNRYDVHHLPNDKSIKRCEGGETI